MGLFALTATAEGQPDVHPWKGWSRRPCEHSYGPPADEVPKEIALSWSPQGQNPGNEGGVPRQRVPSGAGELQSTDLASQLPLQLYLVLEALKEVAYILAISLLGH